MSSVAPALLSSFQSFLNVTARKPLATARNAEITQARKKFTSWLDKFIRTLYQDATEAKVIQSIALRSKVGNILAETKFSKPNSIELILDNNQFTTETQKIIDTTLCDLFHRTEKAPATNVDETGFTEKQINEISELTDLIVADLLLQVHKIESENPSSAANYIRGILAKLPPSHYETTLKTAFYTEKNLEKKKFILDTLTGPMASFIKTDGEFITGIVDFINDYIRTKGTFNWQKYFFSLENIPFNQSLFDFALNALSDNESLKDPDYRINIYHILAKFTEINVNRGFMNLLKLDLPKENSANDQNQKTFLKILGSMKEIPDQEFSEIEEYLLKILIEQDDIYLQDLAGFAFANLPKISPSTKSQLEKYELEDGNRGNVISSILQSLEPGIGTTIGDELNLIARIETNDPCAIEKMKLFAIAICKNSSFHKLDKLEPKIDDETINQAKLLRIKFVSYKNPEILKSVTETFIRHILHYFYVNPAFENIKRELKDVLSILGEDFFENAKEFLTVEKREIDTERMRLLLITFNSLLTNDFGKEAMRMYQSRNPEAFDYDTELIKISKKLLAESGFTRVKKFLNENNVMILNTNLV